MKQASAKDKNFYEEALETRMNQIEDLEVQFEQLKKRSGAPTDVDPSDMAHLRVENKRLQNMTSDLKRELQIEQAKLKMSQNESEQLSEEIKLLHQRVNLEQSMQDQLKS